MNPTEAAEEIGVSYTTLHRLVHGSTSVVSWRTVRRLERWLQPQEWQRVERYIFDDRTRRTRKAYVSFLSRELSRFRWRRRTKHEFLFSEQIKKEVDRFRKRASDLGCPAWREQLATLRVFDPIVAWPKLRQKLSDEQILRLVKAGYRREKLLLSVERTIV